MAKLRVFDLQRFALHDGPGIRTTVFLKGCPLDCIWCHNPESKKREIQLGYLEKKCIGCGKCEKICKHQVHQIENHTHRVYFEWCIQCGACVDNCPGQALKLFGQDRDCDEILATVEKDMDYYRRSGGGLTVSGGEPMMQFEGLLELLKKAKQKGIHVCLDTSGQARTEKYEAIAPYVDLFLFDYKITDPEVHRTYIGTDNRLILKNLRWLCEHDRKCFLRCPIIPGINDVTSHYQAIADLSRQYPAILQVNLMIYHDMAKGKASQIGETYALANLKTVEKAQKQKIYEAVRDAGCLRLTEG